MLTGACDRVAASIRLDYRHVVPLECLKHRRGQLTANENTEVGHPPMTVDRVSTISTAEKNLPTSDRTPGVVNTDLMAAVGCKTRKSGKVKKKKSSVKRLEKVRERDKEDEL
ncbi:hypothetical protein SK128_006600 [Halocaridina rubra]|uniref:Uncharacterized protein n=1 Tax=Halocaridina rubra TaxID=373956 RepID=A0AAN8ZXE3_HALRR